MTTQETLAASRTGALPTASSAEVDRFSTNLRMFRRNAERSASASAVRRLARRVNRVTGRPWLMYLAVEAGVRGVRRYGETVSAQYGVSKRDQFLRLSIDRYLNHTPLEEFYLYQRYLPERWKSRAQHFTLQDVCYAQECLVDRLASPDLELLKKDKFAAVCKKRNLPTIPVVAEFFDGSPQGAFVDLPSADLFSKPTDSSCGRGAQAWRYDPASDRFTCRGSAGLTKQAVVAALCEQSKSQKLIVQRTARNHPDMGSVTNGALATIRIVTCRTRLGTIDMLPPVIRMPAGAGVVDNFNNGGVVAPLDRDNGTIIGPGIQKDPETAVKHWTVHPDTGVPLSGFVVPRWSEIVKLALCAQQGFPTLHFIGWDIAVLRSGPVLVEGNEVWDPTVVVLPHGITLSDTQFIPYFNYHVDRLPRLPHQDSARLR
jgi:hypothetical protein